MMRASPLSRPSPSPSSTLTQYVPFSPRVRMRNTPIAACPPRSPPVRWVGVDAATQWTPKPSPDYKTTLVQAAEKPNPQFATRTNDVEAPVAVATPDPSTQLHTSSPSKRKSDVGKTAEECGNVVKSVEAVPTKRARAESEAVKVLPLQYELCEVADMVVLISDMVSELLQTNDQLPLQTDSLTRFHSRYVIFSPRTESCCTDLIEHHLGSRSKTTCIDWRSMLRLRHLSYCLWFTTLTSCVLATQPSQSQV